MKFNRFLTMAFVSAAALLSASCSDKESYADLLNDETHSVNAYLADFPVISSVPDDGAFITTASIMESQGLSREEAEKLTPFYRMDEDGLIYMQVVSNGTTGVRAEEEQLIYFRFMRYNLKAWYEYDVWEGSGNATDLGTNTTSFRYKNTTLTSTTQWGEGIQLPLEYLDLGCEVNIIIKSSMGPEEEIATVYPYLYNIRYYASKV
ncbi:MAG: DUF4827 domain-containing protein [Muribaculaceae bacterium]|nr:DUF4827 domain-containing protein [Muribaculaceae bacterium]